MCIKMSVMSCLLLFSKKHVYAKTVEVSICQFSIPASSCTQGERGLLEPIAVERLKSGDTLDKRPVHYKAKLTLIHTPMDHACV